MGCAEKAYH
jgi:hypothetical protein